MHNSPVLTKEEAREQFERHTKELGLVHTFDFDEVYDFMMGERKKKEFRHKISLFEEKMKEQPNVLGENPFPLEHTFGDGTYIRKLTVPAKTLTVTKIHAVTHPFFLMKGSISIYSENGVSHHTAPYNGITLAGTKRIIYHHDEVIFITVHPNPSNCKNIEILEEKVTVRTFDELPNNINELKERLCHS